MRGTVSKMIDRMIPDSAVFSNYTNQKRRLKKVLWNGLNWIQRTKIRKTYLLQPKEVKTDTSAVNTDTSAIDKELKVLNQIA